MARYLLINAGANNNGATQAVLETVLQAIPQGSQGELVCLGDCGIHYCRGCKACYETGRCVQRDGMDGLMERMDQADGIIFAVPSYWADIPGQCKVFIDRCTAKMIPSAWSIRSIRPSMPSRCTQRPVS